MTTTAAVLVPFDELLERYDPALGLEVHVELNTATKMFCGCPAAFGSEPNTNVCPTCLGLPGSMPAVNRKAVESAIRIGLALNCSIAEFLPGHAEELPDLAVRRTDLLRGLHGRRR
jgi:aspartyl-tRNA(Asn)/glutamyl-tRNA(Gln) amidotransferase subunit B